MAEPENNEVPLRAVVFLSIFVLPFILGGLLALKKFFELLGEGHSFVGDPLIVLVSGLLLVIVPAGMWYLIFWLYKNQGKESPIKARNPGQPWKWDKQWEAGMCTSRGMDRVSAYVAFPLVISVFAVTMFIGMYPHISLTDFRTCFLLLFTLITLIMIPSAMRAILQYLAFGNSTCHFITHPGIIGDSFRCVVTSSRLNQEDLSSLRATLICKSSSITKKSRSNRKICYRVSRVCGYRPAKSDYE